MLMMRHLRDMLLYPPLPGQTDADAPRAQGHGTPIRAALLPLCADMTRAVYGESRIESARMLYVGSERLLAGARVRVDAGTPNERTYRVTDVKRYPMYQSARLRAEAEATI